MVKKGNWNPEKWGIDSHGNSAIVGGWNWICECCGRIFVSREQAMTHEKNHEFACPKCKTELNKIPRHAISPTVEVLGGVYCPKCGYEDAEGTW